MNAWEWLWTVGSTMGLILSFLAVRRRMISTFYPIAFRLLRKPHRIARNYIAIPFRFNNRTDDIFINDFYIEVIEGCQG